MVNGKRPWRKDLFQRYMGVVNSEVVGEETQLEVGEGILPSQEGDLERAMGFEPTTSCLGSKHSTPELRPLNVCDCTIIEPRYPCILMGVAKPPLTGNGLVPYFVPPWPENRPKSRNLPLGYKSRWYSKNSRMAVVISGL
jgi:hypothetical protein